MNTNSILTQTLVQVAPVALTAGALAISIPRHSLPPPDIRASVGPALPAGFAFVVSPFTMAGTNLDGERAGNVVHETDPRAGAVAVLDRGVLDPVGHVVPV